MFTVVLLVSGLFLVGAVIALRAPSRTGALLDGNDPARADVAADADARGAVNRNSWMLGGGGGGGGA
jgi:hypothetical protein